jgi:hypothetical protein
MAALPTMVTRSNFLEDPALFPPRTPTNDNELGAGIDASRDLPQPEEVVRVCAAICNSPDALKKLGAYDEWVKFGIPLARLGKEDPQNEATYQRCFMQVSSAAPNFDEAAAQEKWSNLLSVVGQDRDIQRSWRSVLHFARQHGYADPQETDLPKPRNTVTIAGNPSASDPLRFTSLSEKQAVQRINTEYLVLRTSGKIYRLGADGEVNAVPKHDFKTALGGARSR